MFGIYSFSFRKDNDLTGIKALTGTKGHFMIGEVDLSSKAYDGHDLETACFQRIEQEIQPKNGLQHYTCADLNDFQFFLCDGDENHQDTKFRDYITHMNPKIRPLKDRSCGANTEILTGISKDEIKDYFQAWQKGDRNFLRTLSFPLRDYQRDLSERAAKIATENPKRRVLIHLSTRGGKSFVALKTAQAITQTQNILVLTPFPSAVGSFREIVERHRDFIDWWFFDRRGLSKHDADYVNPNKNVYFLSLQKTGRDQNDDFDALLRNITFDTIIVDETHTHSATARSQRVLDRFPDAWQIHLSGTPFGDIYSKRFTEDEIVTCDFIDLMEMDKKAGHKLVGFPELTIKNVCNMRELNDALTRLKPDMFEHDEQFSLKKVFDGVERAQHFFDFAFNPKCVVETDKTQSLLADPANSHILLFVPSVRAVHCAYEALIGSMETIPFLNEYAIARPYKGEKDDSDDFDFTDFENSINEFQAANKKTIIITCAKLTTGVTLKKCDCILLMKSLSSAEVFIQTLFRCMTGDWANKKRATLYNYDSEACLSVMKEVMQITQLKNGGTQQEALHRVLNVINIQSVNSHFDFIDEDASSYLAQIKEIPVRFDCDDVVQNLDLDLTDDQRAALTTVAAAKSSKKLDIAKGHGGNERVIPAQQPTKAAVPKAGGGAAPTADEAPVITRDMKARVKALFRNLDWEIVLNCITDVDQLLTMVPETCAQESGLLTIFQAAIQANRAKLAQFIADFNDSLKNRTDTVYRNLSMLNDTDFVTPDALCERLCSKMAIKATDTVCDPCCGRGAFLQYIHRQYGVPKDSLYGIDIDPRNVAFLRRCGFKHVVCGDALLPETWEKLGK